MPSRRTMPVPRNEILAFVLAGLLALAVVALSGWGGDPADAGRAEGDARTEATEALTDAPAGAAGDVPSVDP